MWYYWLILAGLFLTIEILNSGFLIFWFAVGALIAMIISVFTNNVIIQSTVFLIVSVILLFATRPFVQKVMRKIWKNKNKCIFCWRKNWQSCRRYCTYGCKRSTPYYKRKWSYCWKSKRSKINSKTIKLIFSIRRKILC